MKGIVFTEFFDLIEEIFGADMLDDVLDECDLETNGAYTAVGTYDHKEFLQIIMVLSHKTNIPVTDLVKKYGHCLFFRFHDLMPEFFEKPQNSFEFLESVHDTIHVEVKKLYPDAHLPHFQTQRIDENTLEMTYTSQCPFADFAHGLIHGCIDFYKENIEINGQDQNQNHQFSRLFTLIKKNER